jgi:hypothetical protein
MIQTDDQVMGHLWRQVSNQVREQVTFCIRTQVCEKLWWEVSNSLRDDVLHQVLHQVLQQDLGNLND